MTTEEAIQGLVADYWKDRFPLGCRVNLIEKSRVRPPCVCATGTVVDYRSCEGGALQIGVDTPRFFGIWFPQDMERVDE